MSLFSNLPITTVQAVVGTGILLVGVIDDLRSRKFHNELFLICGAVGLTTSLIFGGFSQLVPSVLGLLSAFAVMLPLVLFRVVGAGDLKLLVAFGTISKWEIVLSIALFALVWGAIFGVIRIIVNGQGLAFARNLFHLVTVRKSKGLELHHLPYSVALFFGWLSYLTIGAVV